MDELLVFQSFSNKNEAMRVAEILENNGIEVNVEESIRQLDSNFFGQQTEDGFLLRIPGESFDEANKILEEQIVINLEEVDKGYLLLSFTNEELIDVLKHKSDWGIYNYKLAERLLLDRNIEIPSNEIKQAQKEQLVEKANPKGINFFWIILTYLVIGTALFSYVYVAQLSIIVALAPLLFVIVFGYTLYFSKNVLSNGKRYPTYFKAIRLHGVIFMILGIILTLVLFFVSYGADIIPTSPSLFHL